MLPLYPERDKMQISRLLTSCDRKWQDIFANSPKIIGETVCCQGYYVAARKTDFVQHLKEFASNWTKATKNALVTLKETTKTETYSKAAEAPAV